MAAAEKNVFAALLIGCGGISESERQQVLATLKEDPDGDALEAAFRAATADLSRITPGTDPCGTPFSLDDTFLEEGPRWVAMRQIQGEGNPAFSGQVANVTLARTAAEVPGWGSAGHNARKKAAEQFVHLPHTDKTGAQLLAEARALVSAVPAPELILVVKSASNAGNADTTTKSFDAGLVFGDAYLYDAAAKAIVCAGPLLAQSSQSVQVWTWDGKGNPQGFLDLDLLSSTISGAVASLRSVAAP